LQRLRKVSWPEGALVLKALLAILGPRGNNRLATERGWRVLRRTGACNTEQDQRKTQLREKPL
jgi:hypothetical protein